MSSGSWVLILGANSDIALSIARRYAEAGFNLYLASRDIDKCVNNATDIGIRFQVEVEALFFDACDYASHKSFYSSLKVKPEGFVMAFGVMHKQQDAQSSFMLSKKMIDSNLLGSISISEIIAEDFEKCQRGFIVGISSVAGDRGRMSNYIYGSSKAGFSVYLSGLAHRLSKSNVLVLTVKPGFVFTKMTYGLNLPTFLTAQPIDVGNAVYKAVQKKKNTIYVLSIWRFIMVLIKHIPTFIFHKTSL
jgi:decaprenylphospho-beta-D-erythro-pentofuranosid-2-ulose 2-reductase